VASAVGGLSRLVEMVIGGEMMVPERIPEPCMLGMARVRVGSQDRHEASMHTVYRDRKSETRKG